jgi:hypothetical protein
MNKDITLFYPEAGMSTNQLFTTSRPRDYHIVTDSPFLVPLYDRLEVFILVRGKWVNPDFQTYGCSYSRAMRLWNEMTEIPAYALDGKVTNCMGSKLRYK